jgi:hypothetical protein
MGVLSLLTVPNIMRAVYADFLFSMRFPRCPWPCVVVRMGGATVEQPAAFGTLILLCRTEPNESAFQLIHSLNPRSFVSRLGYPSSQFRVVCMQQELDLLLVGSINRARWLAQVASREARVQTANKEGQQTDTAEGFGRTHRRVLLPRTPPVGQARLRRAV